MPLAGEDQLTVTSEKRKSPALAPGFVVKPRHYSPLKAMTALTQ